jgi:hypothetical protein
MMMKREDVMKEIEKLMTDKLGKYNGLFEHMNLKDKDNVSSAIAESFVLGLEYGLEKAKEMFEEE